MKEGGEKISSVLGVAYASNFFSQAATQMFFFIIYRFLSPAEVGIYSWAVAVAMIYAYVLEVGLASFLVGELSRTAYTLRPVGGLIFLARAPVLVGGMVLVAVWHAVARPGAAEFQALSLMGLTYVFQMVDSGLASWFQVRQLQNIWNLASCAQPLVRVAGAVALAIAGTLSLGNILWLMVLTQVLNTAGLVIWARFLQRQSDIAGPAQPPPAATTADLVRHFRRRGPRLTVMYAVVAVQGRLDWILVSVFLSKGALANYALANKVVEAAMLLAAIWARTSFPWISRGDDGLASLRPRLVLLRKLFVLASMLAALIMAFWSLPVLRFCFAAKYAAAEAPILIMAPVAGIFMMNQYLFYNILAEARERAYIWVLVISTAIQTAVNLVFLPRVGISAAAFGMVAMGFSLHAGQMYLLRGSVNYAKGEISRQEAFLGGGTLAVAALVLARWGLGTSTITGLVLLGILGATLIVGRADCDVLRGWLKSRTWVPFCR